MRTLPSIAVVLSVPWLCAARAEGPAITIHNQNYGVVREAITLDLKAGVNEVRSADITAHLDPDSVMLRDPTGTHRLQILEQSYRAAPLSQELLLSLFEGQTIEFWVHNPSDPDRSKAIRGRIVRSNGAGGESGQTLIEVDGRLQFGLPGTPLFPSLRHDTVLRPTLQWLLDTDVSGELHVELSYITSGLTWKADYNVVAPGDGELLDLAGWITMNNQTGKTFEKASIKLMAGEVSKIEREVRLSALRALMAYSPRLESRLAAPVTEQPFDEYHLYTLAHPTTLRDGETKQVEFLRATNVQSQRVYVYDGARIAQGQDLDPEELRVRSDYGAQFSPKVAVMREFRNNQSNHLDVPLPAGRVRFYRRDDDGRLEFTGEGEIGHTAPNEPVRVYTGNAFDLVGERRQTRFQVGSEKNQLDETFEIKLRNHKKEPVEVRVVEHLYRWTNWEIREKSDDYLKTDAQTIEFRVAIPPDGEKVVTYLVHYSW